MAIDLQRIDWRRGTVEVPARGKRGIQTLALPHAAIQVILQSAGSTARRGQAITGGRGNLLTHRDLRLDRLRDALGAQAPDTLRIEWNFHGIRASAADELSKAGVDHAAISAVLGHRHRVVMSEGVRPAADVARSVVEQWGLLLVNGPAPGR